MSGLCPPCRSSTEIGPLSPHGDCKIGRGPNPARRGDGGDEHFIQAHRDPQRKTSSRLSPCHRASWNTCAEPIATHARIVHIIIHFNMTKKHQLYTRLWFHRAELAVYRFGWSCLPVLTCFKVLYVCCLGMIHERYALFASTP